MRDSLALRQRLLSLACLPALALALGCSGSEPGAAKADGKTSDAKKADAKRADAKKSRDGKGADGKGPKDADDKKAMLAKRDPKLARADAKADAGPKPSGPVGDDAIEPSTADPNRGQPPPEPGTDPRYLPVPGDPPYVDGYNPEEETCPSGNWCGTIATATAVAPKGDATPPIMQCPSRIVGAHDPSPIKGPAYEGLSDKRQMQGAFNEGRTKKWRADGTGDACCYHWFEYCSGRPLLDGTDSVVAEPRALSAWIDADVCPVLDGLTDEARSLLARAWLDDALREHASVASFARAAIELMACGAPPELVDGCMRAGQDEVDHARRCFALASAYSGRTLGPGPLPPLGPRARELPLLAVETFLEGCVGETIAALVAERSLTGATDEAVRATLRIIAEDESRHAALAWRTVAWALSHGGAPVGVALLQLLDAPPQLASDGPSPAAKRARAMLAAHGRLDSHALTEAVDDAWRDIIAPMLRSLVGQPSSTVMAERA